MAKKQDNTGIDLGKFDTDLQAIEQITQNAFQKLADQMTNIFAAAREEGKSIAETVESDINRTLQSMARTSQKFLTNLSQINSGYATSHDLNKQVFQAQQKQYHFGKFLQNQLDAGLIGKRKYNKMVKDTAKLTQAEISNLQSQLKHVEMIEAKMGGMGDSLKLISKIPIVGPLLNANKALEKMTMAAAEVDENGNQINSKFAVMGVGIKSMGQNFSKAFGPAIFMGILKGIMEVSKVATDLQRNMQLSADASRQHMTNLAEAAHRSGDVLANTTDLAKTELLLNQASGTSIIMKEEELLLANKLRKTQALSEGSLKNILQISRVTGVSYEQALDAQLDGYRAVRDQTGIQLELKGLLEETNKVHGQIRAQLGGSGKLMMEAVAKAKTLGMELNQVAQAGKHLLNFEQSISSELEAEILTGKQLYLERARLYALTGDYDGLMGEINKNVGDFYEFSKLNVLQQDALAASLGMSSDQMSDMLFKEADLATLKEKARADGNDELLQQLTAIGIQERFNETILKLKDAFNQAFISLEPLINGMVGLLSNTGAVYGIMTAIAGLSILKLVSSVYALAANMFLATGAALSLKTVLWGVAAFVMVPLIIGLIASAISGIRKQSKKAQAIKQAGDLKINPNGGPVVMNPTEGSIFQGTKNDGLEMSPFHGGNRPFGGKDPLNVLALQKTFANSLKNNNPVPQGLSKQDLIEGLLEVENKKSKQNIILKQGDPNWQANNVMRSDGDQFNVIYERSFA